MVQLSAASQAVVDQARTDIEGLPEDERTVAARQIRHAAKEWIPGSDGSKTKVWMTLIVGLLLLAGLCVIGGTLLAWKGKDAAALFAAVTGIVGLLVGLFSAPAATGE